MAEVLNNLGTVRHTHSYKTLNNRAEFEFSHIPNAVTCTMPEGPSFLKVGYFKGKGFLCNFTGTYSPSPNVNLCVCV